MKKLILFIFIFSFLSDLYASYYNQKFIDAIRKNNLTAVEKMIKNGVDVKKGNNTWGETPLHEASERGYTEIAEALIKAGADVNQKTAEGDSPLHIASEYAHLETSEMLIKNGAHVNAKNEEGERPLHKASFHNNPKLAELLIENKANVNAVDQQGQTALHIAFDRGRLKTANVLVEKGTDIHIKNKWGENLLHMAAQQGSAENVELFIKKGADPNAKDSFEQTALHMLAALSVAELYTPHLSEPLKTIEILLKNKANVDAKDENGKTPLHVAARNGQTDRVRAFIEHGADVNAKDKLEQSPLLIAYQSGNKEVQKLLIEEGAKIINMENKRKKVSFPKGSQNNDLHDAVKKDDLRQVKSLIEKGAYVNARNEQGQTALMIAIEKRSFDLSKVLITIGKTDLNIRDFQGKLAFDYLELSEDFEGKRELKDMIIRIKTLSGFNSKQALKNYKRLTNKRLKAKGK